MKATLSPKNVPVVYVDKIAVIKQMRACFGLGLKDAKDLCEAFTDRNLSSVSVEGVWDVAAVKRSSEYDELTRLFEIRYDSDTEADDYVEALSFALKKAMKHGYREDCHTLLDLYLDRAR